MRNAKAPFLLAVTSSIVGLAVVRPRHRFWVWCSLVDGLGILWSLWRFLVVGLMDLRRVEEEGVWEDLDTVYTNDEGGTHRWGRGSLCILSVLFKCATIVAFVTSTQQVLVKGLHNDRTTKRARFFDFVWALKWPHTLWRRLCWKTYIDAPTKPKDKAWIFTLEGIVGTRESEHGLGYTLVEFLIQH